MPGRLSYDDAWSAYTRARSVVARLTYRQGRDHPETLAARRTMEDAHAVVLAVRLRDRLNALQCKAAARVLVAA